MQKLNLKLACLCLMFFLNISTYEMYCQTSNSGWVIWGGGGVAIPINESRFIDSFKTHFNVSSAIGYIFNERVQVRASYEYNRFKNSDNKAMITPEIGVTGKISIHTIKVDFLYGSFRKCGCVQHYGIIGIGAYPIVVTKKYNNESISDSDVYLGLGGGIGFSFGLISTIRIFAEGQYHYIFNDGTVKGYMPIKAGISYQFEKK